MIDDAHPRAPGPNDEGETLLELMIAVAIMGIAVVAIVGGIATSILMSDIHRKQATAGAYVRNYAEAVVAYVAVPATSTRAHHLTTAPRRSASQRPRRIRRVGDVRVVLGRRKQGFSSCCPTASAVQQVTLNIASSDSRASEALLVIVRKP